MTLNTDQSSPGLDAAFEALTRFRLVSSLLPDLRLGETDVEALRAVLVAINDCLDSCCDTPRSPLQRSLNAAGAARLLLRDHLMTEGRACLN